MRKLLRHTALTTLKASGVFHFVQKSEWRRQRLLILCYHGISLADEHQWRPFLYISPGQFERRLEILKKGNYTVLPLGEALERLFRKDLPPRSVVLTFDDGAYDFYAQAHPRIKQYGFPATVYLTTYYSEHQWPVFGLMCMYLMWKARNQGTANLKEFGVSEPVVLDSAESRQTAADRVLQSAESQNLTGEQKNQIVIAIANRLKVDYEELHAQRVLHLMTPQEVKLLAQEGVDFQLHTHRHRVPVKEDLFRQEIRDNRARLANSVTGVRRHFCYPSGAYRPEFLQWLSAEDIISATTCDTGFAHSESNPLLLPRLVDTTGRSEIEFESWLTGVGHFISSHKRARLAYVPD